EDTLAGRRLALVGVLVSTIAGLSYLAYLGANQLAFSQQAEPVATAWLEKIKNGQLDEAFCMTLPQPPPPGPDLHDQLEIRFNSMATGSATSGGRGDLTAFEMNELVRFVQRGGPQTTIKPLGIREWVYRGGGYLVRLNYDINTPEGEFEALVTVQGSEGKMREGWRWMVSWPETHTLSLPKPTLLGQRLIHLQHSSGSFIDQWMRKLGENDVTEAFLDTLEPAEREQARAAYREQLTAHNVTDDEAQRKLYLPGYQQFDWFNLVHAEPERFWAPKQPADLREPILAEVRKLFEQPGQVLALALRPDRIQVPLWTADDKKVRLWHDMQIVADKYGLDGALVTETDVEALQKNIPSPPWRLAGMYLRRGRLLAAPPSGPTRMQ